MIDVNDQTFHSGTSIGLFQINDYLNKENMEDNFDMSIVSICNKVIEDGDLSMAEVITRLEQIKTQYQVLLAHMNLEEYNDDEYNLESDF